MATLTDRINDAFIDVLVKEEAKGYEQYIRSIRREFIDNVEDLDAKKVRQIVRKAQVNVDTIALLFIIQNAILLAIRRQGIKPKQRSAILPIITLLGIYSIKNPKRFVKRIIRINKGVGLNANEKKAQAIINEFKRDNAKVLADARRLARKQLDQGIIKSGTSRRMVKDFNKLVKEKKSIKQIKNSLTRKYNKLSNVERVLDTELHRQAEFVRLEHSKALGYTHKTWKTQQDSRVRHTNFHNNVANDRIPIDSKFRAGGLEAEFPSDTSLPPSESIRCRCYLVYD